MWLMLVTREHAFLRGCDMRALNETSSNSNLWEKDLVQAHAHIHTHTRVLNFIRTLVCNSPRLALICNKL